MSDNVVRVEHHGAVALVVLNRPERLNALTYPLMIELRKIFAELDAAAQVRAIVLTGEGRGFCAGADLRGGGSIEGAPSDAEGVLRTYYNPLIAEMAALTTPTIAAVNGTAAGAGASLALACDLRVAAESASFQMAFVKVGLVPDAGASWMLPRLVGAARAAEMALLGRAVRAPEALGWGLVNEVIPDDQVRSRALELAGAIAELSSSTGTTRQLLWRGLGVDLADQLDAEATAQGIAERKPDFAEAKQAFAEKRRPNFQR
ncbi:enoyl-CoA hydratase/isomerase family protein [Nocardia miyunensis]|uniref:enoyl-CoA hydratase/isomerase family protein n=1 Tax=Nocardia miyunensis TaxID=282684 RepID=UPI0008379B1C|nr:enoyl-CoA hydratase-related protein [Nocardia miyunensis]